MNISIFSPGIVPPLHYGGTERVIEWLINELTAQGNKVYFLGPEGSHVPSAEKVFYLDFPEENINAHPIDFRCLIPGDTDIVHIHCATNLDYGYPVLKTVHGYPFFKEGNFGKREQFDQSYSFVSDAHRRECGRPENPYVHNGIDLTEYIYAEDKDDYLLFLGKVDWVFKGLPLAVQIANETRQNLIIAGDFLDPSFYEKGLKGILNDRIRYVGPVGGRVKAQLLSRAKALIFPTVWPEPFGLVAAEAMASGTPVITTTKGAMPEVIQQGVTGFTCVTFDEMREAVKLVEQIKPEACRRHVEKYFTSRRMAINYQRLYRQIIRRHKMEKGLAALPRGRPLPGQEIDKETCLGQF